ncbi:hypothetical protein Ocin01_14646 [Orchesella cincta]|uniref:Uncharacterized protein n=1 Tax=Orchesella cincta TaxID=48709 RepID=A0A1D2MGA6_ORCCI|nr:hypothetical protein Ocin01_14646 [Orchesella cincta]
MSQVFRCATCSGVLNSEVFHCTDGVTICNNCINKQMTLDSYKFYCRWRNDGCTVVCKIQYISQHQETCYYNPNSVRLCQLVGYNNCKFIPKASDRDGIINHFREGSHPIPVQDVVLGSPNPLSIQHADFQAASDSTEPSMLTPVLVSLKNQKKNCEHLILVAGKVDVNTGTARWAAVCVWKPENIYMTEVTYQLEFTLEKMGNDGQDRITWSVPVISLEEAGDSLWQNCPIDISLPSIKRYCLSEEGVLTRISFREIENTVKRVKRNEPDACVLRQ